jgi:hypothetical protein
MELFWVLALDASVAIGFEATQTISRTNVASYSEPCCEHVACNIEH